MKNKINLDVVTQEKRLLQKEVDSVTVVTEDGEITILKDHTPLLSKLTEGMLTYRIDSKVEYIAIFGGFIEVSANNSVSILADAASRAEEIDERRADEAKKNAQEALKNAASEEEMALAEAALRKASLELKVAHHFKRSPTSAL